MKIKSTLLAFAVALSSLSAETVKQDTVVFSQTDAKSPIIARLKAGTTITPVGEAPTGWKRIEVSGPFDAYVNNHDITKGLDVREGASVYSAPRKDAPIIATTVAGDKTELVGLANSDWAQIKLDKKIQGFIAVGETANKPAAATPAPKVAALSSTTGVTSAPIASVMTPTPAPAPIVTTPGRPAPVSASTVELPRVLAGKLVVAKRLLINPNPPYDYQIADSSGRRLAYIDMKRLLLTDKIEAFIDRNVSVTGTWRNTVDGKDIVIAAESMKLDN